MYLNFYNLKEFPFAITCDERFFYESPTHAEALANMMYAVQQRKGMVLVSGEIGAGKTFLGNMLGSRLGPGCTTVSVVNPPQSPKQLMRALALGVGMNVRATADKLSLTDELQQHLGRMHRRGRLVALVLDEVQDFSASALEEVRLLWNWEQDGARLVQMVLAGQPDLRDRLQEPKWEALRQRIVLSYHLVGLSAEEMSGYVNHRPKVAAGSQAPSGGEGIFTPEALRDVYAATDGIPRLVNILCDNALLVGYARSARTIDSAIINAVLKDMTCWGLRTPQDAANAS